MGIFNFFRSEKPQSTPTSISRTPEQVVQHALATQGIETTAAEVEALFTRLKSLIDVKLVLPEDLAHSDSAELEFTGERYLLYVSMRLQGGGGKISEYAFSTLLSCALYWASASEIAKSKGVSNLSIAKGQKIAVCDYTQFGKHPIYVLFPELLNKTALR
jgi:hypothetical protein